MNRIYIYYNIEFFILLTLIIVIIIYFIPLESSAYFIESDYIKNTSRYYYSLNEIKKEESIISYKKQVISDSFLNPKTFTNILNTNYTQAVSLYKKPLTPKSENFENIRITKKNKRLVKKFQQDTKLPKINIKQPEPTFFKELSDNSETIKENESKNKKEAQDQKDEDRSYQSQKYYTKIAFYNSTEIRILEKLWVLLDLFFERKVNFIEHYKDFALSEVSLGLKYNFLTYRDFLVSASCGIKNYNVENDDTRNATIFSGKIELDLYGYKKKLKTTNFAIITNVPYKKYDTKSQEPYLSFALEYALNKTNITWGISFKNEFSLNYFLYSEKKNKLKFYNYLALSKSFYYSKNIPIIELEIGVYYDASIKFNQKKSKLKDWGVNCAFAINF